MCPQTSPPLPLLLGLLWKAAWAPGTSSPKVCECQIFIWLIVWHIPITASPSPAQMPYVRAEIRAVGVGPPPHSRWLALLRLFLVLTYLFAPRLLTVMWIWEGKKEKTSSRTDKKNQEVSFPRVISKHRKQTQEAFWTFSERRETKKWAEDSSLVPKQHGQLSQGSHSDRRRHFQPRGLPRLSNILAGFQFLHNEEQVFSTWSFSFKYLKGGKSA